MELKDYICFKNLHVSGPRISKDRISATYRITFPDGRTESNDLSYNYETDVFDPDSDIDRNLASMILAQVSLNYGLFCREIIFEGNFDDTDQRYIKDMMENTSREIYINKLLWENPFIKDQYRLNSIERKKNYTAAQITFRNSPAAGTVDDWKHWDTERNRICILSSGGKDSQLSYGIIKETGNIPFPVFINESGRHWFTALNTYRYLKENEKNTMRVWSNSDRVFNWFLRQMPFIRPDFNKVRADDYPIRLWTVAVFLFGVIPLMKKEKMGRMIIGDEYDTTRKLTHSGITHYDGLYDQSRYFDNACSRYFMKKGWNISQFSVLRSLSELLILKILVKRYPELQRHQVSCHAAHEHDGRILPCGNCEKCRRIVGMLRAVDEDPRKCGFTPEQVDRGLKKLENNPVKQIGPDAGHLYHLLLEKGLISPTEHSKRLARPSPQILKLRFDNERSLIMDIPDDLRVPLFRIFLEYADGAVRLVNKKWEVFNPLKSGDLNTPYPFELGTRPKKDRNLTEYLWAEMSWPEIEEKLRSVDLAILPCGAIEQHGPHLPVDVDAFDAEYLARKVAEACSDPKPFVLPLIPYGVSYHHDDFPGTLSISNNALSRVIYEIGMNLARSGIRKLIILNGHGDNLPTLQYAAQMINRDANIFVAVETGETSDEDLNEIISTPNDIHAGEIETSTTLAIRPHLVKMDLAKDSTLKFGSTYLNFSSARGVSWYVRTKKITESGIMGNPTRATAEKGRKMWEIMIAQMVKFVEDLKNTDPEELFQKRY